MIKILVSGAIAVLFVVMAVPSASAVETTPCYDAITGFPTGGDPMSNLVQLGVIVGACHDWEIESGTVTK